ncbi:hypothetical protein C5S39_06780 [Candidatus Methanophagaceae archaeon]|nr:hypothetical protein C5S39_06780 [Methanophagales archaeon]
MVGAEKEETVKKCAEMLENTMVDTTVPRNIRRSMSGIEDKLLNSAESHALRAAERMSDLEVLTTHQNIPVYARTVVWSIITQLETVSVEG